MSVAPSVTPSITPELSCASRIVGVEVYARGAMITRRVEAPSPFPRGAVELVVGGITPLADPGSLRVSVGGGREVVAARSRLRIPDAPAGPGEALETIRRLEEERERWIAEQRHLEWRREVLTKAQVVPELDPKRHHDPLERVRDATAIAELFGEVAGSIEERLAELDEKLERQARAIEAARVAAAQARSSERAGAGHPTREFVVRVAAGEVDAGGIEIELSYVVGAARWWPIYAARVSDGATRVELCMGALVAQASGEDWTDVALALSTADLIHDARLPELSSLRLGRVQPPVRRGYRPPPAGLDEMFAAYDAAVAAAPAPPPAPPPRQGSPPERPTRKKEKRPKPAPLPAPEPDLIAETLEERGSAAFDDEPTAVAGPVPGAPPPQSMITLPSAMPAPAPAPRAAKSRSVLMGLGPRGGGPPAGDEEITANMPVASPVAIEPADAWLDFDSLALSPADDRARRGRLVREPAAGMADATSATASIEALAPPLHAHDPRSSRGLFDHRWVATARAEVPSDARAHRVVIALADAGARPRFVTVPRESAEVYREVLVDNPFDAPLLAGPVDVFLEGALVTTAALGAVDRGGTIQLGLGVEERIRVARNSRVEEGTAGLLGGSTAIDHTVTIDLRSSLARAVSIEVLDRVPVTNDSDVEITRSSRPEAEAYDQAERGSPIRGGLRWIVELAAGGNTRIESRYRIKLSSKHELVGGNRRE